jgi:hypothetical protein
MSSRARQHDTELHVRRDLNVRTRYAGRTRTITGRKRGTQDTERQSVTLKVSEKGGVSVYGLGRFPVTLYKEQWLKLLDMTDDIRTFISVHESELKAKEDKLKE